MALTIFRCALLRNASEQVQSKILNSSRTIKTTIDLLLVMFSNNSFLYCNLLTCSNEFSASEDRLLDNYGVRLLSPREVGLYYNPTAVRPFSTSPVSYRNVSVSMRRLKRGL